jgi:hypothetical protein
MKTPSAISVLVAAASVAAIAAPAFAGGFGSPAAGSGDRKLVLTGAAAARGWAAAPA